MSWTPNASHPYTWAAAPWVVPLPRHPPSGPHPATHLGSSSYANPPRSHSLNPQCLSNMILGWVGGKKLLSKRGANLAPHLCRDSLFQAAVREMAGGNGRTYLASPWDAPLSRSTVGPCSLAPFQFQPCWTGLFWSPPNEAGSGAAPGRLWDAKPSGMEEGSTLPAFLLYLLNIPRFKCQLMLWSDMYLGPRILALSTEELLTKSLQCPA